MAFNQKLATQLLRPAMLRWWMLRRLPMGLMTGMVIQKLDQGHCSVTLKDRFWIRNPFGSVFWAVMGMAAEMSTGALLYTWLSGTHVKFILVGMEVEFKKKVRGKSSYFCHSGKEVEKAIEALKSPGDTLQIKMPVWAHDKQDDLVAQFTFTWSLRLPEKN